MRHYEHVYAHFIVCTLWHGEQHFLEFNPISSRLYRYCCCCSCCCSLNKSSEKLDERSPKEKYIFLIISSYFTVWKRHFFAFCSFRTKYAIQSNRSCLSAYAARETVSNMTKNTQLHLLNAQCSSDFVLRQSEIHSSPMHHLFSVLLALMVPFYLGMVLSAWQRGGFCIECSTKSFSERMEKG